MAKIRRALISVYDKMGVATFARGLVTMGIEILSTGGTAKLLEEEGIEVKEIGDYTGFPEILQGRVKTLHPKIHAGILAKRDNRHHSKDMENLGIDFIDMVVVNLYPFEQVIKRPEAPLEEVIENIDIGGPTMLRAAAKNYQDVVVVSSPEDYPVVIKELKENKGNLSLGIRRKLAAKVFEQTCIYDSVISSYLNRVFNIKTESFPLVVLKRWDRIQTLRYGENPHQEAALYGETQERSFEQLQGKELSYNNILDLNAAWIAAGDFADPVAVIIKHTNPCGLASDRNLLEAYRKALSCDPVSAFGSVIGFNRRVSSDVAEEVVARFVEAVIAPEYEETALQIFKKKEELRVIKMRNVDATGELNITCALDCFLLQRKDYFRAKQDEMKIVTKKKPSDEEWKDLLFGWRVVKNVKSNAIVLCKDSRTIAIGAGQMSRIDAMKLALSKACEGTNGTILASDAFFPFSDVVEEAHRAGITAIIQPGGSKRDGESIEACDKYGIAMVFTGERHFRH